MKGIQLFALCCATAATSAALPEQYVLPEMGTVNTHALSTGNLYPAIARP